MGCHWQEWGECTKSCGGGMQYRYCLKGGMDKEMRRCNEQECGCIDCPTPTPPPKCTWTDWSDCSVTCGTGWQTRECTGGAHGRNQQTQYCHEDPCPPPPIPPPTGPAPAWVTHSPTPTPSPSPTWTPAPQPTPTPPAPSPGTWTPAP